MIYEKGFELKGSQHDFGMHFSLSCIFKNRLRNFHPTFNLRCRPIYIYSSTYGELG